MTARSNSANWIYPCDTLVLVYNTTSVQPTKKRCSNKSACFHAERCRSLSSRTVDIFYCWKSIASAVFALCFATLERGTFAWETDLVSLRFPCFRFTCFFKSLLWNLPKLGSLAWVSDGIDKYPPPLLDWFAWRPANVHSTAGRGRNRVRRPNCVRTVMSSLRALYPFAYLIIV